MSQIGCSTGCSAEVTEPYALRVLGDSMLPEFQEGHIIIVDPGYPPCHGAFVVVDYGGEVILGQYSIEGRRTWLRYLNPDYPGVELIPPYEIKGVVIQRAGRRRREHKHYDYSDRLDVPTPPL